MSGLAATEQNSPFATWVMVLGGGRESPGSWEWGWQADNVRPVSVCEYFRLTFRGARAMG